MIAGILAAFSWLKNSWVGKAVAIAFAIATAIAALLLYNRNQQSVGAEKKTASDLKEIDKKVEAQKQDEQKHGHKAGDALADELRRQQEEMRKWRS